ncbi:MAG TPA: histidine phosphatase family protein [Xanthobacteraceae bacterium]|nr:histidine phosphatase family protein [Xanthobacteraceae bacterium]
MRLMLLRHAKAEKAEKGGTRDRDRCLNGRGRKDAAQIAAYIVRHKLLPDRVLVSAAQRTRETWEHMLPAFSKRPPVAFEERLYDAGPEDITAVIKAEGHSARVLLLIGHNPGIYDTARALLMHPNAEHQLADGLPTAGLVVIDFAGNDWRKLATRSGRLVDFATPRLIAAQND